MSHPLGVRPAARLALQDPAPVREVTRWRDTSLPMERATSLALRLVPFIVALGVLPQAAVWGWGGTTRGFLTVFHPLYFFPGLLATVFVHEGLHAAGFLLFGRAPRKSLHFGIDRATWSPYAGCRIPMTARAYRCALLLPAVVLGAVPLFTGWLTGAGWMMALGTLQMIGASGDLVTAWSFRHVQGGVRVKDHPDRVGCQVADG